jgi:protein-S-isoprenylcysteine O-methyltransferase Ste14
MTQAGLQLADTADDMGGAGTGLRPADPRPASVAPIGDGLVGLAALTIAWVAVMWLRPPTLIAAWIVLLATALPMLARELARHPAQPCREGRTSPLKWLIGLLLATAPFLLIHGQHKGLFVWMAAWAVAAPAFVIRFWLEARRNGGVSGGFPAELGKALLAPSRDRVRDLAASARVWALKAFFIPLYAASLVGLLALALSNNLSGPAAWLALAVTFAYTVDLSFGLSGYVMASNSLAPTVRSTQTRLTGWVVCLLCYGPLIVHWHDFEAVVNQEIAWPRTLGGGPLLFAAAGAMLALLTLYVWATVCFGLRFCNLSNRGLISSGPYRFMRHPAYFAHAGNAWIITLVFMPAAGVSLSVSQMLVPPAFTLLYWLRAVTEEQHLREDPDYAAYAAWIDRNGLAARVRRLFGWRSSPTAHRSPAARRTTTASN